MTISDETLMAYVDGELDVAGRASVEAAMQQDPGIGKRIARHRALREKLQGAFSAVLEEPVPDRLIQAARGQRAKAPAETARGKARWRTCPACERRRDKKFRCRAALAAGRHCRESLAGFGTRIFGVAWTSMP